ncbi:hypothetical protein ACFE04_013555 [Oxalis oulophora]
MTVRGGDVVDDGWGSTSNGGSDTSFSTLPIKPSFSELCSTSSCRDSSSSLNRDAGANSSSLSRDAGANFGGEPASVGVCRLSRRGRRVSVFGLCGDVAATTYDGTVVIACGDFGGLECVGRDERDRRHGMAIVRARNDDCVD